MADQKNHRYNFIYKDLVENSGDFIGLVAYSIYKQEKIAYVKRFEDENGRVPEPSELKDFHDLSQCRIPQYKEMAERRVSDFYEGLYKAQSEQLEAEYKDRLLSELKSYQKPFWLGLIQNIISAFVTTILIGLIVLCTLYSQHGVAWIIKQIANAASAAP